jgi:hypothetical protein
MLQSSTRAEVDKDLEARRLYQKRLIEMREKTKQQMITQMLSAHIARSRIIEAVFGKVFFFEVHIYKLFFYVTSSLYSSFNLQVAFTNPYSQRMIFDLSKQCSLTFAC